MGCDLTDVLGMVERQGIRLKADGGQLLASPKDAVSDDLRGLLREHKAAILVRLQCDDIIRQALVAVNRTCPHDWQPTPDDWCGLDEIELRLDKARDRGDMEAVRRLCAEYETVAERVISGIRPDNPERSGPRQAAGRETGGGTAGGAETKDRAETN